MMPLVKRRGDDRIVPLSDDYESVMRMLGIGQENQSDKKREYIKELLGTQLVHDAPPAYWEAKAKVASGIPHLWDSLSVDQRAQIKAIQRIENMIDIVSRHRDLQERNYKNMMSGSGNANKAN